VAVSIIRVVHHEKGEKVAAVVWDEEEVNSVQVWELDDFIRDLGEALGVQLQRYPKRPSSEFVAKVKEITEVVCMYCKKPLGSEDITITRDTAWHNVCKNVFDWGYTASNTKLNVR